MQQIHLPPLHVPRPYAKPKIEPLRQLNIAMSDGACIATFIYAPTPEAPVVQNAATKPDYPVLMLHGNGEEHGIFGPFIDALVSLGRCVIAVDSRSQGKSTRGNKALSYELMASDAMAVLDATHTERAHLLGFSDGAIEGLICARSYPDHIASLVAIGANLTPEGLAGTSEIEEAARANALWAIYGDDAAHYADGRPAPTRKQAARTAELLRLMVIEPHIDPMSLSTISCPTTIMAGEHDDIPYLETHRITSSVTNAREVIVAGADHTLPKVAPESILRELLITIAQAESKSKS